MTKVSKVARRDLHREVAEKIVAQLEQGVRPWARPWNATAAATGNSGLPLRACGKPYKGINVILLWLEMSAKNYVSRHWMTYKQADAMGGQVRKGERGTKVYYSDRITKTLADDKRKRGEPVVPGDELVSRPIWFLREYTVFNADQVENLPARFVPLAPTGDDAENEFDIIEHAEHFFASVGANIKHGGDRACYVPIFDLIQMPHKKAFREPLDYYSTLAHEHIHWTGIESRCNRTFGAYFGDDNYALEELVAEMGAAFLCAELSLSCEPREDHAQYLASWCRKIIDKPLALFAAATKASAAVEFLLNRGGEIEEDSEGEEAPEVLAA
jgi:antirestriction protein ArdC